MYSDVNTSFRPTPYHVSRAITKKRYRTIFEETWVRSQFRLKLFNTANRERVMSQKPDFEGFSPVTPEGRTGRRGGDYCPFVKIVTRILLPEIRFVRFFLEFISLTVDWTT